MSRFLSSLLSRSNRVEGLEHSSRSCIRRQQKETIAWVENVYCVLLRLVALRLVSLVIRMRQRRQIFLLSWQSLRATLCRDCTNAGGIVYSYYRNLRGNRLVN